MKEKLNLPDIFIPEISPEIISEIKSFQDSSVDQLPIVSEHEVLKAVVMKAKEIIDCETTYRKEPIETTRHRQIQRVANCTDISLAQLAVCEAVQINGYGRFNGGHASVIIPSEVAGFWHLEGEQTNDAIHSSKANKETITPEQISATNEAIELMSEKYSFVYVYRDARSKTWKLRPSKSKDIRGFRQQITDIFDRGFIIMDTITSRNTLHAIDILESIKRDKCTDEEYLERSQLISRSLKHLVPNLK